MMTMSHQISGVLRAITRPGWTPGPVAITTAAGMQRHWHCSRPQRHSEASRLRQLGDPMARQHAIAPERQNEEEAFLTMKSNSDQRVPFTPIFRDPFDKLRHRN